MADVDVACSDRGNLTVYLIQVGRLLCSGYCFTHAAVLNQAQRTAYSGGIRSPLRLTRIVEEA